MAVTALIKFAQGATVGADGQALTGVAGVSVTVENSDNTDVSQWSVELLYAPPGSALEVPPGAPTLLGEAVSATPSAGFVPDLPGCYRIRLTVLDSSGNQDVDIRNFAVPLGGKAFIQPPYQRLPDPLPVYPGIPSGATAPTGPISPGAKPDEMNFGGQPYGWAGNGVPTARLMHQLVADFDAGPTGPTGPARFTYPATLPVTGSYMASPFERVAYSPSGGSFLISAPTGPVAGDQFGIKNLTGLGTPPVDVYGNGYLMEDPNSGYTLVPTFSVGSDGVSIVWEHDGSEWNIV
jgi:hypothetical protein